LIDIRRLPCESWPARHRRRPRRRHRLCQRARRLGHRQALAGIGGKLGEHRLQARRQVVALRQQQGRAALHQEFGIAGLVVVDRLRERHQHAAHADRAQFGERQCTGTADHQVGVRIGRGHVGDEGFDGGDDARIGIRLARIVQHLFAGLVEDLHRQAECRDRLRHRVVQGTRALAATQHQQAQSAGMREAALFRRRDLRDLRAHRIADMRFAGEGLREADQHLLRHLRQRLVGHAGGAVLFVHQQRDAGDARGDPARPGREPAEAHHRRRLARAQHARGIAHRAQDPQGRAQQRRQPLAAHAGHRDGVDGDVVRRHQPGFHAAVRAQPRDARAALAQRLRDRQAGEDMAAGTAGHDQHEGRGRVQRDLRNTGAAVASLRVPMPGSMRWRRRLVPRAPASDGSGGCAVSGPGPAGGWLARPRSLATCRAARSYSQETRSSRPIATQVISTLEPPEEISGRVRPLVGSMPRLTPIETKLCSAIHKAMPNAM
jgi:hypothetical protein